MQRCFPRALAEFQGISLGNRSFACNHMDIRHHTMSPLVCSYCVAVQDPPNPKNNNDLRAYPHSANTWVGFRDERIGLILGVVDARLVARIGVLANSQIVPFSPRTRISARSRGTFYTICVSKQVAPQDPSIHIIPQC